MKLTEKKKTIVWTFGRFQPPTVGHQVLVDKVIAVAKQFNADNRIYPSVSNDPKKNPLKHSEKVKWMRKIFKGANIVEDKNIINPFKVMKSLIAEGYSEIVLVVGDDRVAELKKGLGDYIKHKGHDNPPDFKVIGAGKRDPDATDITGMSASKMRKAVINDDRKSFDLGMPKSMSKSDKDKLFKTIKKGMGLKENHKIFDFFDYSEFQAFQEQAQLLREPEILDRLVQQLMDKGMDKGKAYAVAQSQLQKHGVLKKDSQELTTHGQKRNSMSAAERAKDRAAKKDGKKPSDYKYNARTNTATQKEEALTFGEWCNLDEISREARRNMSRAAKRTAKKRAKSRKRKAKIKKTGAKLKVSAQKAARDVFKQKFLRGRKWNDLGTAERAAIEKRIKKISPAKIQKIAKKLLPDIKKSERERIASLKVMGNKPADVDEAKERDYKKEYQNYHSKPEQRANRSKRTLARRQMEKEGKCEKGDGMDVDHKDGNPQNNNKSNLRMMTANKNRGRDNNKWRK